MIEYYAGIRLVHMAAVVASVSLFLLRGALVQAGRSAWALAPLPRYLSYAVDTTLLGAALMLFAILPSGAFSNGWLAAKLVLLPLYIGFGWAALRARNAGRRLAFLAGALIVFAAMFGIARAHHPLGPLSGLVSG